MNFYISLFASALLLFPSFVQATDGLSQLTVYLKGSQSFKYQLNDTNFALEIHFKNLKASELKALNHYNEAFVRKLIMTETKHETSVLFFLKDKTVRVMVQEFAEPKRVSIDFFHGDHKKTEAAPKIPAPSTEKPTEEVMNRIIEPASKISFASFNEKKKLLAPVIDEKPTESVPAIEETAPETRSHWKSYPQFISRIKISAFEKEASSNLTTNEDTDKIAQLAGTLFTAGQDSKAIKMYQQVLAKDPGFFDRQPIHLWKLAEAHFGTGNLTVSESYFEAFIERFPGHSLAGFAKLRRADVGILKAIEKKSSESPTSVNALLNIKQTSEELKSQIMLRLAFLKDPAAQLGLKRDIIPTVAHSEKTFFEKSITGEVTLETMFLVKTVALNLKLTTAVGFTKDLSTDLGQYLSQFRGTQYEPFRTQISDLGKNKLKENFQTFFAQKKYIDVTKTFEELPKGLQSIQKNPEIAFQIATSYRELADFEKAARSYELALAHPNPLLKFEAQFRLAECAEKIKNGALAKKSDAQMAILWKKMKDDDKNKVFTALKDPIENLLRENSKLHTPMRMLLESFTTNLSKNSVKASTVNGQDNQDVAGNFSPAQSQFRLLTTLGKRFADLGMIQERRVTIELLRQVKPGSKETDKKAVANWASQLRTLAEEYRKSSNFLEAGRVYATVGEEANDEKRAETLYKAGLLLYRAGRRQEAVDAFKKAQDDGNNLFYSNLAKERLSQLDAH